jgi:hypothetical protein
MKGNAMKALAMLFIFGLLVTGWTTGNAQAAETPDASAPDTMEMADATPLSADQMGQTRGGFADPGGLIYNFAVDVQTAVNGAEVFSRSLSVSPGINGQLQATSSGGLVPQNLPTGMNISVIGNNAGLKIANSAGQVTTTIMNQTAAGVPSSIIINTGNNQMITQTVGLNLTLPNMATIMSYVHASIPPAALIQQSNLRSIGIH